MDWNAHNLYTKISSEIISIFTCSCSSSISSLPTSTSANYLEVDRIQPRKDSQAQKDEIVRVCTTKLSSRFLTPVIDVLFHLKNRLVTCDVQQKFPFFFGVRLVADWNLEA
jgi:hypothetical protein